MRVLLFGVWDCEGVGQGGQGKGERGNPPREWTSSDDRERDRHHLIMAWRLEFFFLFFVCYTGMSVP